MKVRLVHLIDLRRNTRGMAVYSLNYPRSRSMAALLALGLFTLFAFVCTSSEDLGWLAAS